MTARQLLARHSSCHRLIEHDAGIDARAVFGGVTAIQPRTPAEKPLFLHSLAVREHLESGHVNRLWWFDTRAMLADGLTKGSVDREALVSVCERGVWVIEGDAPVAKELRKEAETDASTTHTKGGDASLAGEYVVTDAGTEAFSGAVTPLELPCSAASCGSDAASAEAR